MLNLFRPGYLGWQRDQPDFRDYKCSHENVQPLLRHFQPDRELPVEAVDLREFFPGPRLQVKVPMCSAIACTALFDYFEHRCRGHQNISSPFFVYTVARQASNSEIYGTGIRDSLKAVIRFGLPSERLFPCPESGLATRIPNHLFALCVKSDARYVRLDGHNRWATVDLVKHFLFAGFPVLFGFCVPSSLTYDADIPFRPTLDSIIGWQSALAVGYDDHRGTSTRGSLLIRSSWGVEWGDHGYGWLPYAFIQSGAAADFWTILHEAWIDGDDFRIADD